MRKMALAGIVTILSLYFPLQAVVPQRFELRNKEDFLRGKFDGVSISSDGLLVLAPDMKKIEAPTEEFYLSFLALEDGSAFLGTGHGGKIFRIGKDGKADLYFQVPEMDVTSLTRDGQGTLYAGTSPNGRIYKISAQGKGEEFFDPAERYIWDLLFLENGRLWAAVGESGGVYEISPQGEGRMVFKTEENHILCLKQAARGDIIAGSGGNGLVYRISPDGRASVLYETPYEEVKDIALDQEGMIYAAASGTPSKPKKEEPLSIQPRVDTGVTVTVRASSPDIPQRAAAPQRGSGALYRINAEGMAAELWSSDEEMVYTLLSRDAGRTIIFGTGSRGRIYSVDKEGRVSLLLQQSSEQVYQLVSADPVVYVLSNNPCFLGELRTEQRFSGEYLSPVLDARILSTWGRIGWEAEAASGTSLQFQTRSGNTGDPNSTWSTWSPPYRKIEEQILSPKGRFLQVKVQFRTETGRISPLLSRLTLFYLQNNVAPTFTRLEVLEPNEVYLKLPDQDEVIMGVEKNLPEEVSAQDPLRISLPGKKVERKGFQTVTWEASDENGDVLRYTIAMKKEGEREWRLLADGWTEALYAFDTLSFPDGTYVLKVTASDFTSNPVGLDLRAERTSRPLVIDNSLPVVRDFSAVKNRDTLEVAFTAEDAYSPIEEVKFLIRPWEWRVVFPVDGIPDSRTEGFTFTLKLPSGADNLITIRVKDSYGNVGVFRRGF